jgi:hypothetical protein
MPRHNTSAVVRGYLAGEMRRADSEVAVPILQTQWRLNGGVRNAFVVVLQVAGRKEASGAAIASPRSMAATGRSRQLTHRIFSASCS